MEKEAVSNAEMAERLLDLVRQLVLETRPAEAAWLRVHLDSRLEHDLGLDSLARVELLGRIEKAFGVELSDRIAVSSDTPRALLEAISAARPAAKRELLLRPVAGEPLEVAPAIEAAGTLPAILDAHAEAHPDRTHAILLGEGGEEQPLTYGQLRAEARRIAAGLIGRGLRPAETVALMLPTGRAYLTAFFGILYAGAIPVPIYPPLRPSRIEEHLRRQARVLENASVRILVTVPEAKPLGWLLRSLVPGIREVATVPDLVADRPFAEAPPCGPDAIALLQYTSGSTGDPKGVVLTHGNLLANIRAMGVVTEARPEDVLVSWLPLYHDMGLIGAWLGSLVHGATLILLSPLAFLRRPASWLEAIHRYRGTISAGPNFAFELCLRKISDEEASRLDLGSLRWLFNGAEPVMADTLRRFLERFSRCGLRPEAVAPVYGLAECSVGLAFPPRPRPPKVDRILREPLSREGRAVPAPEGDPNAIEIVCCGVPLPGHQVRIVDTGGREVGERIQGRLQFKGPSATSGYYRNPEATSRLKDGDWLDSGDLAYVAEGEIYVTGRLKDVILRAGRNLYPQEIEDAVGALPGVRKGCVAAIGSPDPRTGTERLVLLVEANAQNPETLDSLRARIREVAARVAGDPPDEIRFVPHRTILKTSSGKIRRAACRELYESGRIGESPPALWEQYARLALSAVASRLRLVARRATEFARAAAAWAAFVGLAPGLYVATLLLPGLERRWALNRRVARWFLSALADPFVVRGVEKLEGCGPAVFVANHASYLDGIVLVAALPRPVRFVAKEELRRSAPVRLYLERLGVVFLERFDIEQGMEDLSLLAATLRAGQSVLFFPEGTFDRMPGLLPFRMGAFQVAAAARVPVVPVAIRGTRHVLRSESWTPRPGPIEVILGAPIPVEGTGWTEAVRLRDSARRDILGHCGEPDLSKEPPPHWLLGRAAGDRPASAGGTA
jgi:acyl carrier protein